MKTEELGEMKQDKQGLYFINEQMITDCIDQVTNIDNALKKYPPLLTKYNFETDSATQMGVFANGFQHIKSQAVERAKDFARKSKFNYWETASWVRRAVEGLPTSMDSDLQAVREEVNKALDFLRGKGIVTTNEDFCFEDGFIKVSESFNGKVKEHFIYRITPDEKEIVSKFQKAIALLRGIDRKGYNLLGYMSVSAFGTPYKVSGLIEEFLGNRYADKEEEVYPEIDEAEVIKALKARKMLTREEWQANKEKYATITIKGTDREIPTIPTKKPEATKPAPTQQERLNGLRKSGAFSKFDAMTTEAFKEQKQLEQIVQRKEGEPLKISKDLLKKIGN